MQNLQKAQKKKFRLWIFVWENKKHKNKKQQQHKTGFTNFENDSRKCDFWTLSPLCCSFKFFICLYMSFSFSGSPTVRAFEACYRDKNSTLRDKNSTLQWQIFNLTLKTLKIILKLSWIFVTVQENLKKLWQIFNLDLKSWNFVIVGGEKKGDIYGGEKSSRRNQIWKFHDIPVKLRYWR